MSREGTGDRNASVGRCSTDTSNNNTKFDG